MNKILLIEDNDDIRENTAEILELAQYNVITAADGKTGIIAAFENKPDLIICDIMIPELDGYGVLHALQKQKETKNTPFIFLSAKAERAEIRKGMDDGADDYITKPFAASDLLNAVESRLKRASLLRHSPVTFPVENSGQIIKELKAEEFLFEFTENRNLVHYKKKQLIYSEGNHPSCLFYVRAGKVKSFKMNEDGKELAVDLFSQGDFLGYTALLGGSTYKESAVAMTETEIAIIPRTDFEELIARRWEVARSFIKLMARNVAEKEEQLISLAYNSLRKKVAEALLALQSKYALANKADFTIDISRENLATIAGTATESFIRTLGDFRDEQLVHIENGEIRIVNEKALIEMVN
jgi:CRP/FNR family cyclic AMP-dependent transcriptional regulator